MTMVTMAQAARRVERLLDILKEIGAKPASLEGVEAGALSLWEILERLSVPGDPEDPETVELYVTGAGIHDLAAKISAVWEQRPDAQPALEPHLHALAKTAYVAQNATNPRWDRKGPLAREHGSADKVIELYWGCLCLLAGMRAIEMDDPAASSGGKNPDVIATAADGTRWAFAIKTLAETKAANVPKNLTDRLDEALEQIERAECDRGIAVINLKNVLDHNALRSGHAYANTMSASSALSRQLLAPLTAFYDVEASRLEPRFEKRSKLVPIAALVAHATVLMLPPSSHKHTFTQIKSMVGFAIPTLAGSGPGTYRAEGEALLHDLNDVVQRAL